MGSDCSWSSRPRLPLPPLTPTGFDSAKRLWSGYLRRLTSPGPFACKWQSLFCVGDASLAHVTAAISDANIGIRASSALTLRKGDRLCGRREQGHKAG